MCGITGVARLDRAPLAPGMADHMAEALHHRGPDAAGQWSSGSVDLAHRRLSIIDLDGSQQPMVDRDGTVLTYNGEVFNYRQLAATLGGTWGSQGDTEVLHRLVVERGVDGLREVRGQFAFCHYDPRIGRLLLARDAMGVLPLFWWTDGNTFAFASELPALLRALPQPPQIDDTALSQYLAYRAVPAPATLWQGVHKLRPGHYLEVTLKGSITERPWTASEPHVIDDLTAEEALDRLDQVLVEAVELALVADVPVGAYLSGGVDSSLICALASRARQGIPLHTYCATFDGATVDEGGFARTVADFLGSDHVEVPVSAEGFVEEWDSLTRFRGAPLSEPNEIAVHRLAERASLDVKVVLSGEGSDELFAGYPKHRFATATRRAGIVPAWLRGPVLKQIEQRLPSDQRRLGVALRALSEADESSRLRGWFASFDRQEREALMRGPIGEPPIAGLRAHSPLRAMLRHDQGAWLADNLLERGDRMTMSASVELRPPFLDPEVVRLARSIPDKVLLRGGTSKWLVKEVARRYLPPAIVDRRKAGFPVPLETWFRGGLRDMAHDLILGPNSFCSAHLDQTAVRGVLHRHSAGKSDESVRIWTLLSLEVWARQFRAVQTEDRR
ncbi:asparagine synthase [Knoellia sinensis KCTC 19936]|uniref:asparagine synthase (glutamine-hydrolyzing) n=1 Tax=Knoellia sinensis KCTC 19936 TaxID=1385520 RepID=A0A0A0JG50_9MICO|nr:asparagine synthase (glutamine-hydrolyzing) [Knoellia sinensis]KGN34566.1 asparagine synthase [Knoellia sinensis KCTC 19936]